MQNAAIAGKLKKADGARERLRRKCSTPWSMAKTASTRPAMKTVTKTIESTLTTCYSLGRRSSGSEILSEPGNCRRPRCTRRRQVGAIHSRLLSEESVPGTRVDGVGVRAPKRAKRGIGGRDCGIDAS